ncbi:MAG: FHA domain-containing protein [Deltaproteobacteria bacterium]|nr:FHA domain-containing protein [Deltaproteobacteria bacterium]
MKFVYLQMHRGGRVHHFPVAGPTLIGRAENADIHLRDLRVSRLHCRLYFLKGALWVEDVGSNPTLVNERPISAATTLDVGDMLCIGPYELEVTLRNGWLEAEPGPERARAELERLKRRARARPVLVLTLALLVGAAAGARTWRKKPEFEASVTFRVEENRGSSGQMAPPAPKRELTQYVYDGLFTRKRALELIKKHNLLGQQLAIDENWAIEEMRDRIDVKVFRNEFLLPDSQEMSERSARVRISYLGRTTQQAVGVVRELGEIVRTYEQQVRKASAASALKLIDSGIAQLARRIDGLSGELAAAQVVVIKGTSTPQQHAQALVTVRRVTQRIARMRTDLEAQSIRRGQAEVLAQKEGKQLGLRFTLLGWGQTPPPRFTQKQKAAMVALLLFFFGIPLAGIIVATLDGRVYGVEDVVRLGIRPLGQLDTFSGASVGSLAARLRDDSASGGRTGSG